MRLPCGLTFKKLGPEAHSSGCRRNKTKTFLTSEAPWDDFRLLAEVRYLPQPLGVGSDGQSHLLLTQVQYMMFIRIPPVTPTMATITMATPTAGHKLVKE